ncbi:MAG: hypothetical protein R3C42_07290 [Parvularculaceae bacterium]
MGIDADNLDGIVDGARAMSISSSSGWMAFIGRVGLADRLAQAAPLVSGPRPRLRVNVRARL